MKLAEAEWMAPDRPRRHARHAARGRLAGALRERGRVPRLAARLGGARPLRHRLPACRRTTSWPRCSPACRQRFIKRHLRARLEDGQRSEAARQGDLAPRRGGAAPASAGRGRASSARRASGVDARAAPTARRCTAASVVIAAGAWSHLLARQLGDRIPLETERGYNTTLPRRRLRREAPAHLRRPRLRRHAARDRLRVGGAVELGGLEAGRPTSRASKAMLEKAQRFLPGLEADRRRANGWASARRCRTRCRSSAMRAPRRNVLYAFGHGHLGLTQAAATGRLIARSRARAELRRSTSRPSRRRRF